METGDKRQERGDRREETGKRRQETGPAKERFASSLMGSEWMSGCVWMAFTVSAKLLWEDDIRRWGVGKLKVGGRQSVQTTCVLKDKRGGRVGGGNPGHYGKCVCVCVCVCMVEPPAQLGGSKSHTRQTPGQEPQSPVRHVGARQLAVA